jgi:hypothetical protein
MKILAALATLGLVWATGTSEIDAQQKTASLITPSVFAPIVELQPPTAYSSNRAYSLTRIGLSEVERDGIEAAVRGQIRAISIRDAKGAFAFLTPLIQDYFVDAKGFLDTIKRQMPPVLKARGFAFAGLERESLDAIQHVLFTGADGSEWLAKFTVERQSDGRWLIKRCQVERAQGQAA